MTILRRHWRTGLIAGFFVALLGAWAVMRSQVITFSEPIRVGFRHLPPYTYVSPDGAPIGPVVDIIKEICRRKAIPIRWVYAPQGSDQALRDGIIDVAPLLVIDPEQTNPNYMSQPWIQFTLYMISTEAHPVTRPEDLTGHTWLI